MPLIDRYVAAPHFHERHSVKVAADAADVLAHAAAYRPESDAFFARMIAVREWPSRALAALSSSPRPTRRPFGIDDFMLLESSDDEIVFGLAGRFWTLDYGLHPIADAVHFMALDTPGSAKLAVRAGPSGGTLLSTETRIVCADRAAWRGFAPYWYFIRPVSGLIRRRILAAIRTASEAAG